MSENKINETTLLRIQNSEKPYQIVEVNWNPDNQSFETRGLWDIFHVREIKIAPKHLLSNIEEYAWVIHWLLESISTAEDLNIPFTYQPFFTIGSKSYEVHENGNYVVLAPHGEIDSVLLESNRI